jgi:flagellar biosynthetic protein FlhB
MSEAAEKPFEATPQRIEKAKREGNVARSSELGSNVAFAAAAFAVVAMAPVVSAVVSRAIASAASGVVSWKLFAIAIACALVPVGCAAAAGTIASVVQSGGLSFVAVGPKFERLDPFEGAKRVLSRETFGHAARAMLAFGVACAVMAPAILGCADGVVRAAALPAVAAIVWHAAQGVAFAACATGALFAVAEYGAARGAWLRKLRMSLDERKREAKEQDGDPFVRGRRRALHRSLVRGALAKVKDASFVVANPTHVAVALEYRPPEIPVPRVLVRAAEEGALRVRSLAAAHRVPVIEDVRLARALYRDARAGDPIAPAHFVAVAEIVAALARSARLAP